LIIFHYRILKVNTGKAQICLRKAEVGGSNPPVAIYTIQDPMHFLNYKKARNLILETWLLIVIISKLKLNNLNYFTSSTAIANASTYLAFTFSPTFLSSNCSIFSGTCNVIELPLGPVIVISRAYSAIKALLQ